MILRDGACDTTGISSWRHSCAVEVNNAYNVVLAGDTVQISTIGYPFITATTDGTASFVSPSFLLMSLSCADRDHGVHCHLPDGNGHSHSNDCGQSEAARRGI